MSEALITAWNLPKQVTGDQCEGVFTETPRVVVDERDVQLGKKYSGLFRLLAIFQGPDNSMKTMKGTAFAIGILYGLTAAHLVWHPQFGPAKAVFLYPDERSGLRCHHVCVSVAVHAKWMRSFQCENDFAMVTTAKGFEAGTHFFQPVALESEFAGSWIVAGFPKDMPCERKGLQLIECRGRAGLSKMKTGGMMIKHQVNTEGGNSGSPLFKPDTKNVVGIHTKFNEGKLENCAVPINLNGNYVSRFQDVLRHMRDRQVKLPSTTRALGQIQYNGYHKESIYTFGERTIQRTTRRGTTRRRTMRRS
ncbi:hypothetical protein F4678DRAFT_453667 [Xylaria arbuscula]|nr:hypothetical protein F4678DRAFT_453667 [Xylaria arbuscula]